MPKPQPILPHMPWNIKKQIVESADTRTKFSLRQCDKQLKFYVDDSKIHYDRLAISHLNGRIEVTVWCGDYQLIRLGFRIKEAQEAVQKVMKVFRNPKTSVGIFEVSKMRRGVEKLTEALETNLSSLNHQIHVEELRMLVSNQNEVLRVLPYCKPRILKAVELSPTIRDEDARRHIIQLGFSMNKIAETEQWKSLRDLTLRNIELYLPQESIAHFEEINSYELMFNQEDAKLTIENIFNPNGWAKRSFISHHTQKENIINYLSEFETFEQLESKTFRVQRGAQICVVAFSTVRYIADAYGSMREVELSVFYNPDKSSGEIDKRFHWN